MSGGAIEQHVDTPKLLGIEGHFGVVLHLAAHIVEPRGIAFFGKPAADRLYSNLHLQILGQGAAGRWVNHHPEGSGADIRMGPERNYTRTYPAVGDDGKWGTVMCGSRTSGRQEQP